MNKKIKKIIREEYEKIILEASLPNENFADFDFYTYEKMPATNTKPFSIWRNADAYCFKLKYMNMLNVFKDVFNSITRKARLAGDINHRFAWDDRNKFWCTVSERSAKEAIEALSEYTAKTEPSAKNTEKFVSSFKDFNIDIVSSDYKKADRQFSFYASDKGLGSEHLYKNKTPVLVSPKGNKVRFKFVSFDEDSTGEDIYGTNYVSEDGKFKLLIIND